MSETAQSILAAAMSLSEQEREELVERLMESLPAPPPGWEEMSEEEFRAELLRRREECVNGTDPGVPWSEVKEQSLRDIDAASNG
jgi:putative addiction module component (TIGR02574 family)